MVRNVVVYPSANVSSSHGSYTNISDTRGNYDTTAVSHSLSTSRTSRTSIYRCNVKSADTPIGEKVRIKAITGAQTYTRLASTNASSQTASLAVAASIGGTTFKQGTPVLQVSSNQSNYTTSVITISNLTGSNNTYADINSANIQVRISSTGSYVTGSKNNSATFSISAVNLDLQYENIFNCKAVNQGYGIASVTPSSDNPQEVVEGESCLFAATLDTDCRFIGWYTDADFSSTPISTASNYTVASVTGSMTLYPKGEVPNRVYIFSDPDESDKFTYQINKTVAFEGDQINFNILTIEEPFKFAGIYEADSEGHKTSTVLSNSLSYSFVMPSQDVYLYVELGKGVKIYVDCQNCSLVGATSPIQSAEGKTETLSFTCSSSYDWSGIYSDARYQNRLTRDQVYTLTMDSNDVYLYAKAIPKQQIYVKGSNGWEAYSEVWVKENGTWVKKEDFEGIFSTSSNYKRIEVQ